MRFAYLHGFASGVQATKGLAAKAAAQADHIELAMLDLNRPDFAHLTVSEALTVVDEFAAIDDEPLAFIGSSLGGYIATLWASQNPGRVARLLLLCPGFGLAQRWPSLMGQEAFERWERRGHFLFEDVHGQPTPVHCRFIEDIRTFDPEPAPVCPTRIIHGRQDDIVPFESSQRYVQAHPLAKLIAVDDDHRLTQSLELVTQATARWLIRHEEIITI